MTTQTTFTITEVADRLGVNRKTVSGWITAGKLKAHRLGHRTVRIFPADLEAFVGSTSTNSRRNGRK